MSLWHSSAPPRGAPQGSDEYPFDSPIERRLADLCATIGTALDFKPAASAKLCRRIERSGKAVDALTLRELADMVREVER